LDATVEIANETAMLMAMLVAVAAATVMPTT
jgi:hypothetical protein